MTTCSPLPLLVSFYSFSSLDVVSSSHVAVEEVETLRGLLRPAMAELIGSALFIFLSCGAGMTTVGYHSAGASTIGIAFASGMSLMVICYSIGHISGGHLNFAVTLTFTLLRKVSPLKCALYFLAQFIGGLIGIGFLKLITPKPWWTVSQSHRTTICSTYDRCQCGRHFTLTETDAPFCKLFCLFSLVLLLTSFMPI